MTNARGGIVQRIKSFLGNNSEETESPKTVGDRIRQRKASVKQKASTSNSNWPAYATIVASIVAMSGVVLSANRSAEANADKVLMELQLKHIESVATDFVRYILAIERLKKNCDTKELAIRSFESSSTKDKAAEREFEKYIEDIDGRLKGIAEKERDPARVSLYGHLAVVEMFGSSSTRGAVTAFATWDQSHVNLRCAAQDSGSGWRLQQDSVMKAIRSDFDKAWKQPTSVTLLWGLVSIKHSEE